jgi:hypothetical protein
MTARWPLLALPIVTVAVVTLALLTAAAPRPFRAARLWGGPTDVERMALRVEIVEVVESRGEVVERPVAGERAVVRLWSKGFEAARNVALDSEGMAEVSFDVGRTTEPLVASVTQQGIELGLGRIELDRAHWARVARRRGGWVQGQASGGFDVRIAPERGVLAVPFEEGLWIEVAREGKPVAGATLGVTATGGRIRPAEGQTDARGRARFTIIPDEHSLGVRAVVSEQNMRGEVAFGLPVVPGALRARLLGGSLVVEAPVPRDVVYFALVTENQRLSGGRVTLSSDGRGDSSARVPLPTLPISPSHAVMATERDLRSAAAVGWPLVVRPDGEPGRTFDAVDALLLDGRSRGAGRENARRSRVRWATAAFCAVAVLLELALLLFQARTRDRELDAHLAREGIAGEDLERLAPARSRALVLAVAAVALGFLLLAIAAVVRLG